MLYMLVKTKRQQLGGICISRCTLQDLCCWRNSALSTKAAATLQAAISRLGVCRRLLEWFKEPAGQGIAVRY